MKIIISLFGFMMLLSGCAAPFVLLVNPKTGSTVECSAVGIGLYRAIAASNQVDNCVAQYINLGYIQAESLSDEQRQTLAIRSPSSQHRTVMDAPPSTGIIAPNRPVNCETVRTGITSQTRCQ